MVFHTQPHQVTVKCELSVSQSLTQSTELDSSQASTRTKSKGSQQWLLDIQAALDSINIKPEKPYASQSQPKKRSTASLQRLKDIEDALAARPVESERYSLQAKSTLNSPLVPPQKIQKRSCAHFEAADKQPTKKQRHTPPGLDSTTLPIKVERERPIAAHIISPTVKKDALVASIGLNKQPPTYIKLKLEGNDGSEIQRFFSQYPGFNYNPHRETMVQLWALCRQYGWEMDAEERHEAINGVRNAIARQFNKSYGEDCGDLEAWHTLCYVCQVEPLPLTVEECRQAIARVHVNICDLVDYRLSRPFPKRFATEVDLSHYSRFNKKIYPKENAYAKSLLRYLLRHIFNPSSTRGFEDIAFLR